MEFQPGKSKREQLKEDRKDEVCCCDCHDEPSVISGGQVVAIVMMVLGVIGLAANVEFSGWLLFFGILAVI